MWPYGVYFIKAKSLAKIIFICSLLVIFFPEWNFNRGPPVPWSSNLDRSATTAPLQHPHIKNIFCLKLLTIICYKILLQNSEIVTRQSFVYKKFTLKKRVCVCVCVCVGVGVGVCDGEIKFERKRECVCGGERVREISLSINLHKL